VSDLETIRRLEMACLTREVRDDPKALGALLTDGLTEIGRTGQVWTRREILKRLPTETPFDFALSDFAVEHFGENAILATYACVLTRAGVPSHSRRSSIWVLEGERWKMHFHQGTPCDPL